MRKSFFFPASTEKEHSRLTSLPGQEKSSPAKPPLANRAHRRADRDFWPPCKGILCTREEEKFLHCSPGRCKLLPRRREDCDFPRTTFVGLSKLREVQQSPTSSEPSSSIAECMSADLCL